MAEFVFSGLEELEAAYRRAGNVPPEVTSEMLQRMGDVAARAIALSAREMGVYDAESRVHIADKIKLSKPKVSTSGGSIHVNFSGTRKRGEKRVRNAEIAFVNEFGKRGQPARPFIKLALDKNVEKIVQAAQNVFDDWLNKTI